MDPYQALANAVIMQAVKDYRAAYRRLQRFPRDRLAESVVNEITRFFHSGYFAVLTTLDGPALLEKVTEELEKENQGLRR